MPVISAQVAVATTAVKLGDNASTGGHQSIGRGELHITNTGAAVVYLGGPGVTLANGYALAAGASIQCALAPGDGLWAVCATSTTIGVLALAE